MVHWNMTALWGNVQLFQVTECAQNKIKPEWMSKKVCRIFKNELVQRLLLKPFMWRMLSTVNNGVKNQKAFTG